MSGFEDYDYIRFTQCDFHGRSRGKILPTRHTGKVKDSGVTLYAGVIANNLFDEFSPISPNDTNIDKTPRSLLRPDMSTLYPVPWCSTQHAKVAEVLCDSFWPKDGTPQQACPRHVAKQQLQKLEEHGFEILSSFEMEMILKKIGVRSPYVPCYMSQVELSNHCEFLFEAERLLHESNVDVESIQREHEADGFELVIAPLKGISIADAGFKFKNCFKEISMKKNYNVSFISKENANLSMHFNHSLWSGNNNMFKGPEGLSDTAKHWLAGVMKHSKALTAIYSPTESCYRRLHQAYTPGSVYWAPDDRAACVRVKNTDSEKGVYFENRMPSAMSNPYLVLAATVAAGLDGVVNKLECPPPGKAANQDILPRSLQESIDSLLDDKVLVESLGQEFVDWYVSTLRSDVAHHTDDSLDVKNQCVIE